MEWEKVSKRETIKVTFPSGNSFLRTYSHYKDGYVYYFTVLPSGGDSIATTGVRASWCSLIKTPAKEKDDRRIIRRRRRPKKR